MFDLKVKLCPSSKNDIVAGYKAFSRAQDCRPGELCLRRRSKMNCMDELELAFGGENEERFDIKKYADKMKKGDAKRIALNKGYTCSDLSNTLKSNSDIEEKATDTNCVTEVDEEKMLAKDQIIKRKKKRIKLSKDRCYLII
nr:hypothetical protein [Tanacetum cinerariifolium]